MDSHITGDQSGPKPAYTELMGHLDLGECLKLIVYIICDRLLRKISWSKGLFFLKLF